MKTQLKITATDDIFKGTSKTGKPFNVQLLFVHLDGYPFPLPVRQFIVKPLSAGTYTVTCQLVVDRERLSVECDFDNAKALS